MRDLTLDDLADDVREVLLQDGIEVSPATVRAITKHFINRVEKLVAAGDSKLRIGKSISSFYPVPDTQKLCDEFATGEPGMLNYISLSKRGKLNKSAQKFIRTRMGLTIDEHGRRTKKKKKTQVV
jgi:hypothetical protein